MAIAVPVLLVVLTLAYGAISYVAFSDSWDEMKRLGVGAIAARLWRVHLVAMLVMVALAGVGGVVLSTTILRPIRSIMETAQRVAEGRLDLRAETSSAAAPELTELHRTFNAMIERLSRSAAERDRRLVECLPLGVISVDREGCIEAFNPLAARLLAADPESVAGLPLSHMAELLEGEAANVFEKLNHALAANPRPQALEIEAGEGQSGLSLSVSTLADAQGAPQGMILTLRDRAAIGDLERHFGRTDQLALLGSFTLGLAHELRNPLGAIKGLSQLLMLERDLPPSAKDYLTRMVRESDRVDLLVTQLMDLTDKPILCPAPTDVQGMLHAAFERALAEAVLEAGAEPTVQWDLAPMQPLALESGRLTQAFAHLIQNALEATAPGGKISIGAHTSGVTSPALEVRVTNTGSTIAPADRERIFEPFYTTKPRARGLGLTVASQVIVQNGGSLEVEAEPDRVCFVARFERVRPAGANDLDVTKASAL